MHVGQPTRLDLKAPGDELVARTDYVYDEVGRIAALLNNDPDYAPVSSFAYERDKVGNPTRITYQDGRYREYEYDTLYRLTREEHWTPQQANLLWHAYGYDDAGNRTSKRYDSASGPLTIYGLDANGMNQIVSATGTRGTRIDVTATFVGDNPHRVEIVASHTDDQQQTESGDAVAGWFRGTFAVGRGIELWDDGNTAPRPRRRVARDEAWGFVNAARSSDCDRAMIGPPRTRSS